MNATIENNNDTQVTVVGNSSAECAASNGKNATMTTTTLKHFVRYTGNNNDQYVMNQAGYLSWSGEGVSRAMNFATITAANAWAWAANKITGKSDFVVESVEN